MKTFIHNNATFIHLDDIKQSKVNEEYFIGCKSARKCVERHSIPNDKCIYIKSGKMYTKGYKLAEVFVESEYANENILNKNEYIKRRDATAEQQKMERIAKNTMERNARKHYDERDITEAPPLVHLDDNQMFKDDNGDPMDIEMRGERTMGGAYFKAYDIGKAFDYKRINASVNNENSDHV